MTIKFQRMPGGEGLPVPSRATSGSAGIDLTAAVDGLIWKDRITSVPTGFAVEIPPGFVGLVRSRSGLAFRQGIMAFHGTIDSDFRGELVVGLMGAHSTFKRGERIAQLVIVPVATMECIEVDVLDETARGVGGFGSSGT